MSLEAILEQAYDVVMRANEPEIAAVPSLLAMQTTAQDETGSPTPKEIDKEPLPSITITATQQQEMVPNSGVFQMQLEVMCEDAAVRKSGTSLRLDEILRHAARPRLYKNLVAMITAAAGGAENFKCYGLPERGELGQIQFGEGTVSRGVQILFICSSEISVNDQSGNDMELPSWVYTAGPIGDGLFTSNVGTIADTSEIILSQSVIGTYAESGFPANNPRIVLTNAGGAVTIFSSNANADDGNGNIIFIGSVLFTASPRWGGVYTVTFWQGV